MPRLVKILFFGAMALILGLSNPAQGSDLVEAWKVLDDAGLDKALKTDPDRLTKVNRYLDNNPAKKDGFIDDLKKSSDPGRFVDRTSWADDLKRQYDPNGNSANFTTHGLSKSDIPQSVYDDMVSEASAPQYLDGVIKSGSSVPKKVAVSEGYTLYKVVPRGNATPSPGTPFWGKLDELNKHGATSAFEQKMGLPVSSHGAKYDVYKIEVKPGKQVNVFESTIANTTEAGYKTTGGATQSLVLDRSKWTNPEIVPSTEIFPPIN